MTIRAAVFLLCLGTLAVADDFGRRLRDLRVGDRERRREALEDFAEGRLRPKSRDQSRKLARGLQTFLSKRFTGAERALAARALARVERFDSLLDWVAKERDDRVLRATALAFRRAPKKLAETIATRLHKEKDPLLRAIYVRLLGEMQPASVRMHASVALHWCAQAAAAHALARDRDPAVLGILVKLLDAGEPGLVTAAAESLTRLTGQKHGRDIVKWRVWYSERKADAPIPERKPARDDGKRRYAHEVEDDPIRPYYFGIPMRGSRVVFVFDISASMRYKLPLAYDQLARAVKALPSRSLFEVVFFNEFVKPWRGRLSHADPVTKELLVRHLPEIEIKSYTNIYDSLEKALAMNPDEVFLISDGEPNRGRWRLPRDILRELGKINTRRVRINTISVVRTVDGDKHVGLLKKIAEAHGGQAVQRTLK